MDSYVNGFLASLDEKGYSPNTVQAYRNDLRRLTSFLVSKGKTDWNCVNKSDVSAFLKLQKRRGNSDATARRRAISATSFFRFLVVTGVCQTSPLNNFRPAKPAPEFTKPISERAIKKLLATPTRDNRLAARRDEAILTLLYETGMQVSELVSLDLECIRFQVGEVASVHYSGKKGRDIPISDEACRRIEVYLNTSRPYLTRHNSQTATLFVDQKGTPLTRQGVWFILKGYARSAGIGNISTRTLRISRETHLLASGTPLRTVREMLGQCHFSAKPNH
jgi:integrase/recombinase XerD